MRVASVLAVAALCVTTHAKQLIPDFENIRNEKNTIVTHQKVSVSSSSEQYIPGKFTRTAQDNSLCATRGEKQWTGTVDVSIDRRLFYWFFESRNDPSKDPVIVWLNGGPGSSSMFGLFNEIGACSLDSTSNKTYINEWAWNNNASVLFLDQPAGVGFSTYRSGSPMPESDLDGAADFQYFLNTFFSKMFPEKSRVPMHIAAESYGGHYGPVYLKYIIDAQNAKSPSAFRGNIQSLVLVNGGFDFSGAVIGEVDMFCQDNSIGKGIINKTDCDFMKSALPECTKRRAICNKSLLPTDCSDAANYCHDNIDIYYATLVADGTRNYYDIRLNCPPSPNSCEEKGQGDIAKYLNRDMVKKALGVSTDTQFNESNMDIFKAYVNNGSFFTPQTQAISHVLDTPLPSTGKYISILAINGNADALVNTPSIISAYNEMSWSQQTMFQTAKWNALPKDVNSITGQWKATKDGRLTLVTVDNAGHMVPRNQPEGTKRIVDKWFQGGWKA